MAKLGPIRLAVVCAGLVLLVAGWWHFATNDKAPNTPHLFERAGQLRRLTPQVAPAREATQSHSVVVLYQQPQSIPASAQPRIVEVVAPSERGSPSVIREPSVLGDSISQPSPPPMRRGEFQPIAMPAPSQPPAAPQPPALAIRPNFSSPPSVGLIVEPTVPASPRSALAVNEPPTYAAPSAVDVKQEFRAAPSPADGNLRAAVADPAAMQMAAQRALEIADGAADKAQRGMLYSARSELLQSLTLLVHALDAQLGTTTHAAALAAGMRALEEARDFTIRSGHGCETADVARLAAAHRTPKLGGIAPLPSSPVAAQQQYFGIAQGQLAIAVGAHPAGSEILYRLGRLQTALAAHDADPLALHGPQAIAFHQAALATDNRNWLAANELGVLYARYGQLTDARQLLLHSVSMQPHLAGWQNLAAVHRRLGENDLAERAERERELLARQAAKSPAEAAGIVRWVDTKTFAASGGNDIRWPAETAGKAVGASRK
jgi:tetratricopeptide (TPR) repeat protein